MFIGVQKCIEFYPPPYEIPQAQSHQRTAFVVVLEGSDDAVTHDASHLAETKWCIKRNRFVFFSSLQSISGLQEPRGPGGPLASPDFPRFSKMVVSAYAKAIQGYLVTAPPELFTFRRPCIWCIQSQTLDNKLMHFIK